MTTESLKQKVRRLLFSHTPSARFAAHEEWLESQASLMIKLGFEQDLIEQRDQIETARNWLPSGEKLMVQLERWRLVREQWAAAVEVKEMQQRAANARNKKAFLRTESQYRWDDIWKKEAELLAQGRPRREIAGVIEAVYKVPQNTFRKRRREKKNGTP